MIRGMWLAMTGAVGLLVAIICRLYTYHGYHLSTAHALCVSWIGQWGQALSPAVADRCTRIGLAEVVSGWSLLLGAVLLAVGVLLMWVNRDEPLSSPPASHPVWRNPDI